MVREATRSPSDIQKESETLVSRMKRAARNHSGHVFQAYVRAIIKRLQDGNFEIDVADRCEEFLAKLGEKASTARDRRLAAPFGLLWAAGTLAIEGGSLPLKRSQLFNALRRCFKGARAALASREATGADLERQLCEWLCTEAEVVHFKGHGHRTEYESKYDAFRISGEEGEYLLLRMERLLKRFADPGGAAVRSALKCMQRNGGLKTYQNGAALTRQINVGEGARRRFLVVGCQYVQRRAGYEPGGLDPFGGEDQSDLGLRTEASDGSGKIEGAASRTRRPNSSASKSQQAGASSQGARLWPKRSGARRIRRKGTIRRVRRPGSTAR